MKKKLTAIALIVVLLAVAVVGSSLAYFTDTEKATNVFTVGNVDIELEEKMATTTNDWYPTEFVDWEAQALVPGAYGYNKMVLVKNTGENDAYVRVKVRYEAALESVLSVGSDLLEERNASVAYGGKTYETIDGIEYVVETIYTTSPVKAGYYFDVAGGYDAVKADEEMSSSIIKQNAIINYVLLNSSFDWVNKDYGWFSYGNGENKTVVMCDYGTPNFEVDVIVDAIQADGFADYTAAFRAFDNQA